MSPKKSHAGIATLTLLDAFIGIHDPRSKKSQRHPFINIIVIAICGVLCGADTWVSIEQWGKSKQDWLGTILDMENGVPSHDTFGRVFSILSPSAFQDAFVRWVQASNLSVDGRVVAIDGKTLRRSHDKANGRAAIHMVSAWCTEAGVAIGQVKTAEKSNEITAIPALLRTLELAGAIVTIDAMGCQKRIAVAIRERKGDYLLAVKDNQPTLAKAIRATFDEVLADKDAAADVLIATSTNKGHGRVEQRTAWVLGVPKDLPTREQWRDIRSIVMTEGLRTIDGKTSSHHRFFISSLPPEGPERFLHAIRAHWAIENNLHWVLDIAFREDESRIRVGHAAENMARLRHISLNLLKRERTLKVGIKTKRLRAGWDLNYLLKLLVVARSANDDT